MTSAPTAAKSSTGELLALLTASGYGLFVLLPDSHSRMVTWPWVVLWQGTIVSAIAWWVLLVWQKRAIPRLGRGWDVIVLLIIASLLISTLFAVHPQQALWHLLPALGAIAALYGLRDWLREARRHNCAPCSGKADRLLQFQGGLGLAFIVISLSLWVKETVIPELARLSDLEAQGLSLPFDFSVLELRNWAPIGHQNYVAGYLLLVLPLLVGLGGSAKGWQRYFWFLGASLGLIDLYTTSSRGGWLGLLVLCLLGAGSWLKQRLPRPWLGLGLAAIALLPLLFVLTNNRLRTLIGGILKGGSGEFAYRAINAQTGWQMGLNHLASGAGLGNVSLLYQQYRPAWAGRESEWAYQLHSTPVQLWAELGLGSLVWLVGVGLFFGQLWRDWRNSEGEKRWLRSCLGSGLLAYALMSLSDYQLDNLAIAGTIVLYLACLSSLEPVAPLERPRFAKVIALGGLGLVAAGLVWLIPVHRAWQLASEGFEQLSQERWPPFVEKLRRSHQLVPWEPYYSYQLGWNLGNLALGQRRSPQQRQILQQSLDWLETATQQLPTQEFGSSSLAWLLLRHRPQKATALFVRSTQLVPAKRGLFYGLALSLLPQDPTLAVTALTLEGLRNPLFLTSPLWRSPALAPLYPQVLQQMGDRYNQWLQSDPNNVYWHRCRGGLRWWRGDWAGAETDLEPYGTPLSRWLLQLAQGRVSGAELSQLSDSPAKLVLMAWFEPQRRSPLLAQAWLQVEQTPLPEALQQEFLQSLGRASRFEQWLRETAPDLQYRYERTGFNVLLRHIDANSPIPQDFWLVVDNAPMTQWFAELLPSPVFAPQLDRALQPLREQLWAAIERLHSAQRQPRSPRNN